MENPGAHYPSRAESLVRGPADVLCFLIQSTEKDTVPLVPKMYNLVLIRRKYQHTHPEGRGTRVSVMREGRGIVPD